MNSYTLPDNQEDRAAYLREHDATKFAEAVRANGDKKADVLIMSLGAFVGEPELLYVALDYASHAGMTVTLPPLSPEHR